MTVYNVGTNGGCVRFKMEAVCTRTLEFILKMPAYLERKYFKKIEKVNYMNKRPSQIRLFKNKFAFS